MEFDLEGMNFEDIIANAVLSEEDSSEFYSEIAKRLPDGITKNKFLFLSEQEKSHKKIVESIYFEIFEKKEIKKPGKRIEIECSKSMVKKLKDVSTLIEVVEIAMGCERRAELLYNYLRKNSKEGYIKNTFRYLEQMEHGHYISLKTEYTYLNGVKKDPEKYKDTNSILGILFKF